MPSPRELLLEFWNVWSTDGAVGVLHRYDQFFTHDMDWRPPIAGMLGTEYVGREGWARYVSDFGDIFASFESEDLEVKEVAAELFTARARVRATASSGETLDAVLFVIARFRDGLISYGWGTYDDQAAETMLAAILDGEVGV